MMLFIKYSGGMGVSYRGNIDLSRLPGDLCKTLRSEISERNLSKRNKEDKGLLATNSIIYELQYENSDQVFTIDESEASDELLELIDSLTPFLNFEPK